MVGCVVIANSLFFKQRNRKVAKVKKKSKIKLNAAAY